MKKLNWNDKVKVKLNDRGRAIYYHQYDFLNGCGAKIKPTYPEVDENGFSTFQLWDFMHIYGRYILMGAPNVVEDLNFYIEDDALEEIE